MWEFEGESYSSTVVFLVPEAETSIELPADAESLVFSGESSDFRTLAEFDSLMKSAINSGDLDSFWESVTATGQMPLIFGDETALLLYRGQADHVLAQGDFNIPYLRQDNTDLWASISRFEPDDISSTRSS
jgi:hypothetical protein